MILSIVKSTYHTASVYFIQFCILCACLTLEISRKSRKSRSLDITISRIISHEYQNRKSIKCQEEVYIQKPQCSRRRLV